MIGRTNAIGSKNGEIHGAIISVTTDEETLFGKDCFLKKDSVVIETKRLKSTGSCSFIVQDPGDYEISSSDGEQEISEAVTVSNDNIVEKTALPIMLTLYIDGGTVLPVDDVLIWMKCGRVKGKNHTTVEEVIADTDTLFLLMSDENAMKYLERSTRFSDAICADEIAMTYLGQSPYVDSTVLNSDIWISAICGSVYMNKILQSLIPTMTSNTSPSGESYSSALWDTGYAWRAFDGSTKGAEMSQNDGAWYVVYDFKKEVEMNLAQLYSSGSMYSLGYTLYIDVFYDNDWHQISSNTITTEDWKNCSYESGKPWNCAFNKVNGSKIRFRTTESNYDYKNLTIFTEIKVYGRTII